MQTAVALVRVKDDKVVYSLLKQKKSSLKLVEHGAAAIYNMKNLESFDKVIKHIPFKLPEDKYQKFIEILASKEGKIILNHLKNQKTNEIINKYLEIEDSKIPESKCKNYNIHTFIKDLKAEDFGNTQNMLPHKLICLSKEEIYNEFVKHELI